MRIFMILLSCLPLFFNFLGLAIAQTSTTVALPTSSEASGNSVVVPILVSTDSTIGLAQFVVEYNSTILHFENAQVGSGAPGFNVSLVNADLPFSPAAPGTDDNVLIQVSGGGATTFTGTNVEATVLNFTFVDSTGQSPLAFDQGTNKTFLTTAGLHDINGASLTFVDGAITVITAVETSNEITIPKNTELLPNYPNPFNPTTTIRYKLTGRTHVRLQIMNVLGESVRILFDAEQKAGNHAIVWNGMNDSEEFVASGIYFYQLHAGGTLLSGKMTLMQ